MLTHTHTYSELRVSRRVYFEIRKRLEDAGVLTDYVLGERPEKIILPGIAIKIDKDFDDSKDCENCCQHIVCAVHFEAKVMQPRATKIDKEIDFPEACSSCGRMEDWCECLSNKPIQDSKIL